MRKHTKILIQVTIGEREQLKLMARKQSTTVSALLRSVLGNKKESDSRTVFTDTTANTLQVAL